MSVGRHCVGRCYIVALAWVLLGLSGVCQAAFDAYEFSSDQAREQYQRLTEELRCPKCQNQNIADSNAPIAQDLRREVHRMVEEGQSDDAIVDFMIQRYGDFVIYRPRFDASTFLLWFGPLLVGLIGLAVIIGLVLSSRRVSATASSDVNRAKLNQLLNDQEKP